MTNKCYALFPALTVTLSRTSPPVIRIRIRIRMRMRIVRGSHRSIDAARSQGAGSAPDDDARSRPRYASFEYDAFVCAFTYQNADVNMCILRCAKHHNDDDAQLRAALRSRRFSKTACRHESFVRSFVVRCTHNNSYVDRRRNARS